MSWWVWLLLILIIIIVVAFLVGWFGPHAPGRGKL
jgi:hypothetical protein